MDFLKQTNFRYIVIIIIIILAVINLCKINSQENFMVLNEDQNLGGHKVMIDSTNQVMFGNETLTDKLKNLDTLTVAGSASFHAGAYVEGELTSTMSRDEGGQITISNPTKTAIGKARFWSIYNMTGVYKPSGLHFWRYTKGQNGEVSGASTLVLTDEGDTLVKGELTVAQNTVVKGDLTVEATTFFKGDLSVETNGPDGSTGGGISIINTAKINAGQVYNWKLYNLNNYDIGGIKTSGLSFWRYSVDGCTTNAQSICNPSMTLNDDGSTFINGELGIHSTIRKTRENNNNLHIVSDKTLYLMAKENVHIYKCLPENCEHWDGASGNLIVDGDLGVAGNLTCSGSIGFLPRGCIIMFSGSSAPAGWAICDGQDGRPDLRGRFVLGSGSGGGLTKRDIHTNGGEEAVTLTKAQMPRHNHGNDNAPKGFISANAAVGGDQSGGLHGGGVYHTSTAKRHHHQFEGGDQPHTNMPPYYVLLYIMKL
jgi:microcystin-dependent protein